MVAVRHAGCSPSLLRCDSPKGQLQLFLFRMWIPVGMPNSVAMNTQINFTNGAMQRLVPKFMTVERPMMQSAPRLSSLLLLALFFAINGHVAHSVFKTTKK